VSELRSIVDASNGGGLILLFVRDVPELNIVVLEPQNSEGAAVHKDATYDVVEGFPDVEHLRERAQPVEQNNHISTNGSTRAKHSEAYS
jgi:hypothetical protein